ncbi:expressed unknown protein [Seminavis robusta]|uniref:Uncharacterized protein n=1 Tax=Seminavis robusta TaxID=568900 RepID=A0A9N8DP69_9STRA|nr:expressed unknown protein [Seminavis robusta]|eukprot:Sro271_g104710.1 n/a (737) ;mRNA; r:74653-76863
MQHAGDSTHEEACSVPIGGIARWFPNDFETEGVDWAAFEEHLNMVSDVAFEVTSAATRTIASNLPSSAPLQPRHIAKGVGAIHFAVSCSNPTAPKSVIQRLMDANPDAVQLTESKYGWNVLHCALQFNKAWSAPDGDCDKEGILEMLLHARPDLATEGATSLDEFGLPPLAFAKSKSVASRLVRIMPTKATISILKKIFLKRKLVGGSIEAMEQIVREISTLELQLGRSILAEGILPDKNRARKQSLIEYTLLQSTTGRSDNKNHQEPLALMRLVDLIIQATYCYGFRRASEEDCVTLSTSPPPLECLMKLVAKQVLMQKVLELYQTAKVGGSTEYFEYPVTAERQSGYGVIGASASGETNSQPRHLDRASASTEKILQDYGPSTFPSSNSQHLDKLLKCKEELDFKIQRSLDVLRQTAASLQSYKDMYTKSVEKLCTEAQSLSLGSNDASSSMCENPIHVGLVTDNVASLRALVAVSSMPPSPPKRQKSVESSANDGTSRINRHVLEETMEGAIENMAAAGLALDLYNRNIRTESTTLVQQQEDLKAMDMSYFKNAEHQQSARAIICIAEYQLQKEGLQKCINDIKRELKEAESLGDRKAQTLRTNELDLRWVKLSTEIRDLSREIEIMREMVSDRRQDLGGYMIKARRILHNSRASNKVVRTRASRFLREAKKEMREIMATLAPAIQARKGRLCNRRQRRKFRQHQQQQREEELQRAIEEDEELSRMTKRLKLS